MQNENNMVQLYNEAGMQLTGNASNSMRKQHPVYTEQGSLAAAGRGTGLIGKGFIDEDDE